MEAARAMQRCGVDWYPHSGFIHLDTATAAGAANPGEHGAQPEAETAAFSRKIRRRNREASP